MNRGNNKIWIEEQIKQDSNEIQRTVIQIAREYEDKRARFSTTNPELRENKGETTEFFARFFTTITEHELEVYSDIIMANNDREQRRTSLPLLKTYTAEENYIDNILFKIERIKSSADLPRPSILESLRHAYDNGGVNKNMNDTSGEYKYIPKPIYNYIREKSEWWLQFKSRVNGRDITLHFITFPESKITVCNRADEDSRGAGARIPMMKKRHEMCETEISSYQRYAYKVFIWLRIVTKMADNECSGQSLNIYFYMTPFKKNIPAATPTTREGDTLSAIHVNTGVTRNCEKNGEIIIYRFEEWFKVFIHETMHNFNMDFIETNLTEVNTRLREAYTIPHNDVLLFETYTEAWARIINTMFEVYFHSDVRNQTAFIRVVREKLHENAIFSTLQMVKVLDVMDLTYANITIQSKENQLIARQQYKEDTNIYAYYILGGILSVYSLPFISWCIHNNKHSRSTIHNNYNRNPVVDSIRFLNNNISLYKIVDFLKECSRDSQLLSMVALCEKKLDQYMATIQTTNNRGRENMRMVTTLRMTI